MLSAKDSAKAIRAELKKRGWSSRQVSVRCERLTHDTMIRVTVRSLDVPKKTVEDIAFKHRYVFRDESSGEILLGGNRFVRVEYDRVAVEAAAAPLAVDIAALEVDEEIEHEGWRVRRANEPGEYFRADGPDGDDIYCWGAAFCARQLVEKLVGRRAA